MSVPKRKQNSTIIALGVLMCAIFALLISSSNIFSSKVIRPLKPNTERTQRSDPRVTLISDQFVDDSGYGIAFPYTPEILDRTNLDLCYKSAHDRYSKGKSEIQSQLETLENQQIKPVDFDERRSILILFMGLLEMYEGHFQEADKLFLKADEENPNIPREFRANLIALRGIAALRAGEQENCVACVGASTCIYPLANEAVHQNQSGSRSAIQLFQNYLKLRPDDVGVKWMEHVARLTIGEKTSAHNHLIALDSSWNIDPIHTKPKLFLNTTQETGVGLRGPNMLGGSIWDDFNGDHRPDLFITSGDWNRGASLFVQKADKTYDDIGNKSDLDQQRMAVNTSSADYDNDGDLDALLLRGGWETPYRLSLLRNKGDGTFDDVTVNAGLGEPIATQSATWGDYDLDGDLDLYVAGEYHDRNSTALNHNRLYRNNGDGTFVDVAEKAGVTNQAWAKGVVFGDYNNDGKPDLYVSNMNGFNRLYKNLGDGTFNDVAPELNLTEPVRSFSCWFWDYDNDGLQDLFVAGFGASLQEIVMDMSGQNPEKAERPRLYRNIGEKGFVDVTNQAGLNFVTLPMGSNFDDYDNDGNLDFYLATGRPPYSIIIPNRMFRNVNGQKFQDTTVETGTGHLQKGHGVSFADGDSDGDLDLFVQTGGQTPADKSHNVFFENQSHGRHWLKLKLEGTKSNRSAIGAKVEASFRLPDGSHRKIYRTVSSGSSFGGNSLIVHLGLDLATLVDELKITWPSGIIESYSQIKSDEFLHIQEGTVKLNKVIMK